VKNADQLSGEGEWKTFPPSSEDLVILQQRAEAEARLKATGKKTK
jgi:hypothetical protein